MFTAPVHHYYNIQKLQDTHESCLLTDEFHPVTTWLRNKIHEACLLTNEWYCSKTQKSFERTLFNWTKQDTMREFSRKSSLSKLRTTQKQRNNQCIDLILPSFVQLKSILFNFWCGFFFFFYLLFFFFFFFLTTLAVHSVSNFLEWYWCFISRLQLWVT